MGKPTLPPLPKKTTGPAVPTSGSKPVLPPLPGKSGSNAKPAGGSTSKKSHNPFVQVKDLVLGLPGGLVRAGAQGGKEGIRLADIVLPGGSPQRKLEGLKTFREQLPLTTELVSSPIRTARTLDPIEAGVALARGQKTEMQKRIEQHGYLGTGLATAADVATIAGGVGLAGKALGAGRLAKAAEYERIATAATRAANKLPADSLFGARQGAELAHAAEYAAKAEALRATGPATRAERITAVAERVKTGGAQVGNAPAEVWVQGAKLANKLTGGTLGKLSGAGSRFVSTQLSAVANRPPRKPGPVTEKVFDPVTRVWKHTVLAANPSWHVGNILSAPVLAGIGAGVTPAQLLKALPEARRLLKSGQLPEGLGGGFVGREGLDAMQPRNVAGRAIKKSYAANEYVDTLNKAAIYVAKKAKGYSDQTAVELALSAGGNFGKLSAIERNTVRRVVPFYEWQKHITKLALRLPVNNPARAAWLLHLVDVVNDVSPDPGAADDFTRSTIAGPGGTRVDVSDLGPLGSSMLVNPSLAKVGRSLNPVLRAAFVAATGIDPSKGGKPVSTPESKFTDPATGGFGLRHPVRMAQYLGQQVPQTRQLQDLAAGRAPFRYGTGQPQKSGKGIERGRLAQLFRYLGAPVPEKPVK